MMRGEFESLRAIGAVCPELVPHAYSWGRSKLEAESKDEVDFLLTDFRTVGVQPPEPAKFTAQLAEFHKKSESPTGKFGFHTTTCHAKLPQVTDCWEDSWAILYRKQLEQMIKLDTERNVDWPEFRRVSTLILDIVILRLLEPLQSEGRCIKPCLVHGDLWDENSATDGSTGEPFLFDACSFYAHNEYELGDWRAARHRLSRSAYIEGYKSNFPASEPGTCLICPEPHDAELTVGYRGRVGRQEFVVLPAFRSWRRYPDSRISSATTVSGSNTSNGISQFMETNIASYLVFSIAWLLCAKSFAMTNSPKFDTLRMRLEGGYVL